MAGGNVAPCSSTRASVVATRLACVAPSRSSPATAAASKRSCSSTVAPASPQRKRTPRPPTWNSGSTQRKRDWASTWRTWFAASALASRLSRARRAALGEPVVPDVKRTNAASPAGGIPEIDCLCAVRSAAVRRGLSSTSSAPRSIAPSTRPAVSGVLFPSAKIRRSCTAVGAISSADPRKTSFTADRVPAKPGCARFHRPGRTGPGRRLPRPASRWRCRQQAAVRARAQRQRGVLRRRARRRSPASW